MNEDKTFQMNVGQGAPDPQAPTVMEDATIPAGEPGSLGDASTVLSPSAQTPQPGMVPPQPFPQYQPPAPRQRAARQRRS